MYRYLDLAVDLDALTDGLLRLLTSLTGRAAEDQLGDEVPLSRDVPLLSDLGVDERVIVLQVGTEAEGLKADPDCR